MNSILTFLLVISIISTFSIYGGNSLVKYFADRNDSNAQKHLSNGIISIVGGIVLAIATFMSCEPKNSIEKQETTKQTK